MGWCDTTKVTVFFFLYHNNLSMIVISNLLRTTHRTFHPFMVTFIVVERLGFLLELKVTALPPSGTKSGHWGRLPNRLNKCLLIEKFTVSTIIFLDLFKSAIPSELLFQKMTHYLQLRSENSALSGGMICNTFIRK